MGSGRLTPVRGRDGIGVVGDDVRTSSCPTPEISFCTKNTSSAPRYPGVEFGSLVESGRTRKELRTSLTPVESRTPRSHSGYLWLT